MEDTGLNLDVDTVDIFLALGTYTQYGKDECDWS